MYKLLLAVACCDMCQKYIGIALAFISRVAFFQLCSRWGDLLRAWFGGDPNVGYGLKIVGNQTLRIPWYANLLNWHLDWSKTELYFRCHMIQYDTDTTSCKEKLILTPKAHSFNITKMILVCILLHRKQPKLLVPRWAKA